MTALAAKILRELAKGKQSKGALAHSLDAQPGDLTNALRLLKKLELVRCWSARHGLMNTLKRGTYALTEAGKALLTSRKPPDGFRTDIQSQSGNLFERAWWHLRVFKVSTLEDILKTHAAMDDETTRTHLHLYLLLLEQVGIVRAVISESNDLEPQEGMKWAIAEDRGPKAPIWLPRSGTVLDRNNGELIQEAGKGAIDIL